MYVSHLYLTGVLESTVKKPWVNQANGPHEVRGLIVIMNTGVCGLTHCHSPAVFLYQGAITADPAVQVSPQVMF